MKKKFSKSKLFLYLFAMSSSAIVLTLLGCHYGEESVVDTLSDYDLNGIVIENGLYKDYRDGQSYKVVAFGGNYWMTENLNFSDSSEYENLKGNTWCNDNKKKNCDKYGRLYTWTAAMNVPKDFLSENLSSSDYNRYSTNRVQGICPDGWHIPSFYEWNELSNYVDGINGGESIGTSLKSVDDWEKVDGVSRGTNRSGFNALPAGRFSREGEFFTPGTYAFFWSSEEYGADEAYGWTLKAKNEVLERGGYYKKHGFAVRCVANSYQKVRVVSMDSSYLDEITHDFGTLDYHGKKYKTIKIGQSTWMAENMAADVGSYKISTSNEGEYFYDYETALTICPAGWHLPSHKEFEALYLNVNRNSEDLFKNKKWGEFQGRDLWGFGAELVGGYNGNFFYDSGLNAYYWVKNESYETVENIVNMSIMKVSGHMHSVRCVADN